MALFKKKTAAPKGSEPRPEASGREEKKVGIKNPKEKKTDMAWSVLKRAHITEKATDLSTDNRYVFNVYPQKNKNDIKKAVENIYGVDVVSVNIVNIPPKKRRLGRRQGWRLGYKKAIVQIENGQKIELMPR